MIRINKEMKKYLVLKCPEAHIKKTVNSFFIEESKRVIEALFEYENQNKQIQK